jgi:predicted RNA binding protein YcfA (HicA-like mRNA interferase family)
MPKKIRDLKSLLRAAGWAEVAGGGKGSHTKWTHPRVPRRLTLSGKDGKDAKRYQEKDVARAVAEASNP